MPKIAELIERVEEAGTLKEVRAAVADLTRDRRRRITPALRAKVIKFAGLGWRTPDIRVMIGGKLSAPTIRKIIKEERNKNVDPFTKQGNNPLV